MMPFDKFFLFPNILPFDSVRIDTIPQWLQMGFVFVMAFFAASLLVGFFRQTTASLHTHKDSL